MIPLLRSVPERAHQQGLVKEVATSQTDRQKVLPAGFVSQTDSPSP